MLQKPPALFVDPFSSFIPVAVNLRLVLLILPAKQRFIEMKRMSDFYSRTEISQKWCENCFPKICPVNRTVLKSTAGPSILAKRFGSVNNQALF